jgi:hypothetical protein
LVAPYRTDNSRHGRDFLSGLKSTGSFYTRFPSRASATTSANSASVSRRFRAGVVILGRVETRKAPFSTSDMSIVFTGSRAFGHYGQCGAAEPLRD